MAAPTPGNRPTEVLAFTNDPPEISDSAAATYFYWKGGWRVVGAGSQTIDPATPLPKYFIIRQNVGDVAFAVPRELTYLGSTVQNAAVKPWPIDGPIPEPMAASSAGAEIQNEIVPAAPRPSSPTSNASSGNAQIATATPIDRVPFVYGIVRTSWQDDEAVAPGELLNREVEYNNLPD